MSQPYYCQVSRAFDRAAADYDARYDDNCVMAWMRRVSLATLRATFPSGSHLLEIGCGTGTEALALGRAGYRVLATDISLAMIDVARAKARATSTPGLAWRVLPAGRLLDLLDEFGASAFDGAYASLGALNCEPRLPSVATALARLLRPGASLVCSVMNRHCAWEITWGLLHLQPRQAFRRAAAAWLPAGLASSAGRQAVPVRYYSLRTFARALAPHFHVQSARALPVFLPPPHLESLVKGRPGLFARLQEADRRLGQRWPFRALGDHFLMVLSRSSDEPRE